MTCQVSVIVPMYNAEKTMGRLLDSLLAQTFRSYEIVVVDDGSDDDSLNICRSYGSDRISLFSQRNRGVSAARNLGMEKAGGEYFCFVDADDYAAPEFIEQMYRAMEGADIAICGYLEEFEDERIEHLPGKEAVSAHDTKVSVVNDSAVAGYVWNKMFRAGIIKENGLQFNEDIFMGEDLLFVEQYLSFAKGTALVRRPLYHYVSSSDSVTRSFSSKRLTFLDALSLALDVYDDREYRSAVVNKYYGWGLAFYEFASDKKFIEEKLARFKDENGFDRRGLLFALKGRVKWQYLLYSISKTGYLRAVGALRRLTGRTVDRLDTP